MQFTAGRSELWTSLGTCMYAQVSPCGLVGWTRFSDRNAYHEPVNRTLRVRFLDGRIRDYEACPNGPFIEQWAFADNESAVVINLADDTVQLTT